MADFETPEELFGKFKKPPQMPQMPQIPIKGVVVPIVAIFILFLAVTSSVYSIGPDEVGVVQRFGGYVRTTQPGLHVKLPFGIEKASPVKVEYIFKEEFGFQTLQSGIKSQYSQKNFFDESLMLTGGLNVLVVEWIVQFKVKDPVKLLFNVRNPRGTVRVLSEAVMRQVVGDHSVDEVLSTRRVEINNEVAQRLQKILDDYDTGVQIVTVKLQDVNPPDEVKPSFNEVNEAKQEREKMVNQAWEAYNKAIPRAKGEAEKTISKSEGYAVNRINMAEGDAKRFVDVWNEYKDAEDVTRRRLYLETMQEVLPAAGKKFIVDSDQKTILPMLKLGE